MPASDRPQGGGRADVRTYVRTDVRTYRFPLYSTGLRPLRFPPGPLPKNDDEDDFDDDDNNNIIDINEDDNDGNIINNDDDKMNTRNDNDDKKKHPREKSMKQVLTDGARPGTCQ